MSKILGNQTKKTASSSGLTPCLSGFCISSFTGNNVDVCLSFHFFVCRFVCFSSVKGCVFWWVIAVAAASQKVSSFGHLQSEGSLPVLWAAPSKHLLQDYVCLLWKMLHTHNNEIVPLLSTVSQLHSHLLGSHMIRDQIGKLIWDKIIKILSLIIRLPMNPFIKISFYAYFS